MNAANDRNPARNLPAFRAVRFRELLLFILTANITTSAITAGTASTAQISVSDSGISDVTNPTGTVNALKSPRDTAYSVNSGNIGSRQYIAAARISGMKIHAAFSTRRGVRRCLFLASVLFSTLI